MSKKSQMEILGLAVVIVLILLGFLLYLRFGMNGNNADFEEFADPKMAASTLNAMLKTTVSCDSKKYSITELLQDCYNWKMVYCGGQDSCTFAENSLGIMLDTSLKQWGKGYWFLATAGTVNEITLHEPISCTRLSRQRNPALQPIPIMSGILNVSLGICD